MRPYLAETLDTQGTCDEIGPRLHTAYTKPADPDLARLVESWPDLPAHIRAAIMALIQTANA